LTTARFYVDSAALLEGQLILEGADHHHLSRVLRMHDGQFLQLMDGKGAIARGKILEISRACTSVMVEEVRLVEEERPLLKLFQALPQGRKMDSVVQWSAELGAAVVTPFACSRSHVLDVSVEKRFERWCRIAMESSRVAGRPYLPEISKARGWDEVLYELADVEVVLVADEVGGARPHDALGDAMVPEAVGLVIGPEGGFTQVEREDLLAGGALPVSLGDTVLRTETAGMVLMAAVRCRYGLL
jgi:16S rRNA (uracil1498-N3)-methyltransferase